MQHFLTYKGATLHFSDTGSGSPVVLLHGFLANQSMWNTLVPHIAKTHRVICIDLLGHGQSGDISETHTMEDMADAVKTITNHLQLDCITLIGHSMGGYVSLAFAEAYPNMVKGLCLMNSTAAADSEQKKQNRDRAIEAVKQNHKRFIRLTIPNLFAKTSQTIFKTDVNMCIEQALKMAPQSIVAALNGMKQRKNRSEFFINASFNKMMIVGRNDPILNYHDLKKQTKKSDINVVELEGGHMSHIENMKELTYNIMYFIEFL